jgi:bifunctional non-homologous end joining protein LigD
VPRRLTERGDPHARIEETPGRLDALLELASRDEAAGLGDAPWPPHFRKGESEGARVAPSRAKGARTVKNAPAGEAADDSQAPVKRATRTPRASKMPLVVVAISPSKEAALAGLERWKEKHASAAALLAIDDVLVDAMRGRSSTFTRVRLNLRHVPEGLRPAPEPPDPDDDPTRAWRNGAG